MYNGQWSRNNLPRTSSNYPENQMDWQEAVEKVLGLLMTHAKSMMKKDIHIILNI